MKKTWWDRLGTVVLNVSVLLFTLASLYAFGWLMTDIGFERSLG